MHDFPTPHAFSLPAALSKQSKESTSTHRTCLRGRSTDDCPGQANALPHVSREHVEEQGQASHTRIVQQGGSRVSIFPDWGGGWRSRGGSGGGHLVVHRQGKAQHGEFGNSSRTRGSSDMHTEDGAEEYNRHQGENTDTDIGQQHQHQHESQAIVTSPLASRRPPTAPRTMARQ